MKKIACKNINANEYLLLNHILLTIVVILYASYLFYYNKCNVNCLKKCLEKK